MAGVQIDGVNNKIDFDDDQDTSISSATDDTLVIESGGVNIASITSGEFAINEGSADIDFRVESNNESSMLHVNGGTDTVLIGTDTPTDQWFNADATFVPGFQTFGNGNTDGRVSAFVNNQADAGGPIIGISKSRGTASNNYTVVQDDDQLGIISFQGADGTNLVEGASIRVDVDGTPGADDMPGRIEFLTTANGASSGTERMRINQNGCIGFHNVGANLQQVIIENQASAEGRIGLKITNPSSSAANNGQEITCVRSGSSAYTFLICRSSSSGTADTEFNVRGDGEIFADGGTAMNTPADYAEMFEWKDGNTDSEVRFGYSVILDGDKIVKASDSDDASKIIGVVSAKPAVLGDAAWNKWSQKYLKDEWNNYIMEEYTSTEWVEVKDALNINHSYETDKIPSDVTVPSDAKVTTTESDGVTKLTRRKINPDYDSSKTYVPRQERKEWNAVGLMGKLRLRKGQPTGTNWIKMRDISDTVEEWLIR